MVTSPPKPTVGRIVHFNAPNTEGGSDPQAAIIVAVHGDSVVNLVRFMPDGQSIAMLMVANGAAPSQWSWPPIHVQPSPKKGE